MIHIRRSPPASCSPNRCDIILASPTTRRLPDDHLCYRMLLGPPPPASPEDQEQRSTPNCIAGPAFRRRLRGPRLLGPQLPARRPHGRPSRRSTPTESKFRLAAGFCKTTNSPTSSASIFDFCSAGTPNRQLPTPASLLWKEPLQSLQHCVKSAHRYVHRSALAARVPTTRTSRHFATQRRSPHRDRLRSTAQDAFHHDSPTHDDRRLLLQTLRRAAAKRSAHDPIRPGWSGALEHDGVRHHRRP